MDNNTIRLLEFLSQSGLGSSVNAADVINDLFPIPNNLLDFNREKDKVQQFLYRLRSIGFINYNPYHLLFNQYNPVLNSWVNKNYIELSILTEGLKYLSEYKSGQISDSVNISAIDTNHSIIATNKSVQDTNKALINHSEKQTEINSQMATTAIAQTNILDGQAAILRRQTVIFFFTGVFALFSLIITLISFIGDKRKEQLLKQSQAQSKVISTLQHQLSRAMNELNHLKEAKKNLPKKP